MSTLRVGSMFSGYEGLGLAVKRVFPDAAPAFVADIDAGACKVLAHRFPDVPNLGDVTAVAWGPWAGLIHVLTAGFPCQDVSAAGLQAGLVHGTRSGLFHEVIRAITELRPPLVFLENVRGLLSARGDEPTEALLNAWARRDLCDQIKPWLDKRHARAVREGRTDDARRIATRRVRLLGLRKRAVADARRAERLIVRAVGTVLGSLADVGYDAAWVGLPASGVGGAHGRFRIFILAWPAEDAERAGWAAAWDAASGEEACGRPPAFTGRTGGVPVADDLSGPVSSGLLPTPTTRDHTIRREPHRPDSVDTLSRALTLLPTPAVNDMGAGKTVDDWDAWTERMKAEHGNGNGHGKSLSLDAQRLPVTLLPTTTTRDANASGGNPDTTGTHGTTLTDATVRQPDRWGVYAASIARWEAVHWGPAPNPTQLGTSGSPQLSPRFSEWLMGVADGWITDVPGITRNEALKLCGNGVVPQQGEAALRWLLAVAAQAWRTAA